MNGRNGATTFLPLDSKIVGQNRDSHHTAGQYLTREQARYIYKKTETGQTLNVDTMKLEIEQEKQLDQMDDDNGEVNPYRQLLVNNVEKIEMQKSQMEQWSILSNSLNYVQHSKFKSMDHSLSICPVNRYKVKPKHIPFFSSGKEFREIDFGTNLQNLETEYLDVYEGIQSDIVSFCKFDENSDISMTYLGKIGPEEGQDKLKAGEVISNIREWLYFRKIIRWYEMPVTSGYRCQ